LLFLSHFLCFSVIFEKILIFFFLFFKKIWLLSNQSADEVKRLSLIVDKQEAIKTFLSGITEEEIEEENACESTANVAKHIETIQINTANNIVDLGHNIGESSTDDFKDDCMKSNMDDQNTNSIESKFELDPRFSGGVLQDNHSDEIAEKNQISNSCNSYNVSFIFYSYRIFKSKKSFQMVICF
jgi:hypothetical protein